ncbi:MAG: Rrf2 family transcriptional regulator [Verrucomicrobiales bacterium]
MTQNAISAVSYLAEKYDADGGVRVSSLQIARKRGLPRPVVAKILTILSQAGIVSGAPGPNGGYCLARDPADITLWDVAVIFERSDADIMCPLGPGWCGTGEQCPLHDGIQKLREMTEDFLNSQTFEAFKEV